MILSAHFRSEGNSDRAKIGHCFKKFPFILKDLLKTNSDQ